jgi:hypothetical protein
LLNTVDHAAKAEISNNLRVFLFTSSGRKVNDVQFTSWIKRGFQTFLKVNMTIGDWRHISQGLMSRWCPLPEDVKTFLWFAPSAGHSAETGDDHYAKALSNFQNYSDPQFEMFNQISMSWHKFLQPQTSITKSVTKKRKLIGPEEEEAIFVTTEQLEEAMESQAAFLQESFRDQNIYLQASIRDAITSMQGILLL